MQYQGNVEQTKEIREEEIVHCNPCNILSNNEGKGIVEEELESLLEQKKYSRKGC